MQVVLETKKYMLSFSRLCFLFLTTVYFWEVVGYKETRHSQNYINFTLLVAWGLTAMIRNPRLFKEIAYKRKYTYFYLLLVFVFGTGLISLHISDVVKFVLAIIITFSPIFMADYFKSSYDPWLNKSVYWASILIMVYYSVSLLNVLRKYPTAARELASGSAQVVQFFYGLNVGGGYELIYGLLFLIIFLSQRWLKGYSYIPLSILFAITIYRADYFIAVVFSVLGILMNLLNGSNKKVLLVAYIMCIFGMVLYLSGAFYYIGSTIVSFTQSSGSVLSDKLSQIGHFLMGGQSIQYLTDGRFSRSSLSMSTFLHNPLTGIGWVTGFNTNYELGLIGQHSEWIDSLGRFGVIGAGLYFTFLFKSIQETYQYKKKLYSTIIVFVILGFFDPIRNFTVMFTIFFLVEMASGNTVYESRLSRRSVIGVNNEAIAFGVLK